ncbi:MAG: DUF488 domain-containing protein [Candidatus Hydrogenedentes bacterium]|nr:DUF488 domain-containing protein [Candidatus Hydrogenedentota bacterium]
MSTIIYTIGHSNHTLDHFIGLLRQHEIEVLCDVRSTPASRYTPQFNAGTLEHVLPDHGIAYEFLGKQLGARANDPNCYVGGKVHYGRLAATPAFQEGLAHVEQVALVRTSVLMCAEKDPLACHRTILVSRRLADRGADIRHILEDGRIETHDEAVRRLREQLGMADDDLFRSPDDIVAEAYRVQGERIAYAMAQDGWEPAVANEDPA